MMAGKKSFVLQKRHRVLEMVVGAVAVCMVWLPGSVHAQFALSHTLEKSAANFGLSLALEGGRAFVGAPGNQPVVVVFDVSTGDELLVIENPVPGDVTGGAFASQFTRSIAASGNLVIVAAQSQDVGGVPDTGAVYVFAAESGALLRTLSHPVPGPSQLFGREVALSGTAALVGTFRDGAFLFDVTTGALLREFAPSGALGSTVALSDQYLVLGNVTATVGGFGSAGSVNIYESMSGAFVRTLVNPSPGAFDFFGSSIAVEGNKIAISAAQADTGGLANSGEVHVFDIESGSLLQTMTDPTPNESALCGRSIAMADGILAVGCQGDTEVHLFDVQNGTLLGTLTEVTNFDTYGTVVAFDGARLLASGHPDAVFLYDRTQPAAIPDLVAAHLGSNSQNDLTTVINGRLTLLIDRENQGRYQCYDDTLAPIPCGSAGIPSKGQIFSDLANCPRLDMGDGTELGSDTADGCLLYRTVTPADRAPLAMIVAIQAQHQYSAAGTYTVALETCCRANGFLSDDIHVNNPNTIYRHEIEVVAGVDNSSPSSALPPVVSCPINGDCLIEIPAVDDGSVVSYRLSDPVEAGGADGFNQPTGAWIDALTGILRWNTRGLPPAPSGTRSLYSTHIVISDGLSETTLEVLIRLVAEDPMGEPPIIGPPLPPPITPPPIDEPPLPPIDLPLPPLDSPPVCGTKRIYRRGGEYRFDIAASDPDVADTVTLDVASLPGNAELDPELPLTGNSVESSFTWTPLETGKFVINFYATSSTGSTVQCPVEIEVVDIQAADLTVLKAGFFAQADIRDPLITVSGVVASVANLGNVRARVRVRFEFEPSVGGGKTGQRRITLEPGEQRFVEPSTAITHLQRGKGPWVFRVTIDPKDRVVEVDEGNNVYESGPFFHDF